MKPVHLTRLFLAINDEAKKSEPLFSSLHNEAVADYINKEILNHLKFKVIKMNQMLQHCILNVNYGLSNFQ